MALFTDEAAVYGAFGKVFSDVLADEKTSGALIRTNTILQLQLKEPRSTITIAVRQDQPPLLYFGQTTRRPEVFLQMDAEVAHGWLLGEINPTVAFGDNRIKSRGPNAQVLAILAWAKVLTPRYKAILEENGGELPPPLAPQEPKPAPAAAEEAPEPAAAEASPAAETAEETSAPEETPDPEPAAETPAEPEPAERTPADEPAPAEEEPVADPAPAEEVPAEEPAPPAEAEAPAPDPEPAAETPAEPEPAPAEEPASADKEPVADPAPAEEVPAEEPATPTPDPAPEDEAPPA